jgi:hypothetical protein
MPIKNADLYGRWKYAGLNIKAGSFVVYDSFMKKEREFFVPFLYEVKIEGEMAFITTTHSKVMALNLNTTKRSFLN